MRIAERIALLGLFASACGSEVATVELALGAEPPEEIETITVFVRDLERGFNVASATVSRERTRFPMGVPAEQPLEFTLIARREDPPPSSVGPMPSYVGRVRRRIPLGAGREPVVIVAHPGGAVAVGVPPSERGDVDARPRLEVVGQGDRPNRVYDLARRGGGWRNSFALESGATTVRLLTEQGGRRYSSEARVQLRRDEETLVRLERPRETRPLEVTPSVVRLLLVDPEGEVALPDELELERALPSFRVEAEDAEGQPLEDLPRFRARLLRFALAAAPEEAPRVEELGELRVGELVPLELEPPVQPERWWLSATCDCEPELRVDRFLNLRPAGAPVGEPAAAFLALEEPERLARGTWLLLSVVDAAGYWVRSWTAGFDFGRADADVVLAEVSGRVRPADRGVRLLRVQRSSAPLTGETTLRGTLSSTIAGTPPELELALPPLELEW